MEQDFLNYPFFCSEKGEVKRDDSITDPKWEHYILKKEGDIQP